MTVGIEYTSDPKNVISVIYKVIEQFEEISKDSKAQVGIKEFAEASINIELRYWAPTPQYNQTQYKVNLAIFDALKKNNINIPFPTYNIIKY